MSFGAFRVERRRIGGQTWEPLSKVLPMQRRNSLVLLLSLAPLCLAAQESSADTSGFHAGQWGVQVDASGNLMGVGILHFTSARSALMLRVDFLDRKSTRLNSSHRCISYAVFCLKKKKKMK